VTLAQLGNIAALLLMPVVLMGVIGRVKSLWSGRKGPPILQLAYDLRRLLQKQPVYSTTTTPLFRLAPHLFLVTTLGSGAIAPLLGSSGSPTFGRLGAWRSCWQRSTSVALSKAWGRRAKPCFHRCSSQPFSWWPVR
jgi:formate hydrogenlyase subunit 4